MKRIFYVACAVLLCACVGRADRNRAGATDPMKADGGLVYDVKNFGAVGAGVTDDTRAIQYGLFPERPVPARYATGYVQSAGPPDREAPPKSGPPRLRDDPAAGRKQRRYPVLVCQSYDRG